MNLGADRELAKNESWRTGLDKHGSSQSCEPRLIQPLISAGNVALESTDCSHARVPHHSTMPLQKKERRGEERGKKLKEQILKKKSSGVFFQNFRQRNFLACQKKIFGCREFWPARNFPKFPATKNSRQPKIFPCQKFFFEKFFYLG